MFEVDAVITWVDGADPVHRAKRERHLALAQADVVAQARAPLHDNGTNPHRWLCSDELNYCVRSIANNAPWVRRIWIVTDKQTPEIMQLPPEIAAKISIVDHSEIFAGHDDALPTFNSLSIETMLWRIPRPCRTFPVFKRRRLPNRARDALGFLCWRWPSAARPMGGPQRPCGVRRAA